MFINCSTNSSIPLIDPLTIDIKTLQADLSSCRYSSVDLVRWYFDRIGMLNDRGAHPLHAIIETNPDAFEIAKALDFERLVNGSRSILHGIPILIKDSIATDDKMQTTAGSYALVGARVPRDAFIVEKLRAAGAIILGKTSMSQWANVMSENVTRHGWSPRGGASRLKSSIIRFVFNRILISLVQRMLPMEIHREVAAVQQLQRVLA